MGCLLSFLRTGTFNFRFFGAAPAKRDRKETGEGSRSLEKGDNNKQTSSAEEELAASKIQAGFRGYKTRKNLKTKRKGKGGELSLSSLTPLHFENDKYANETEEETKERLRLEKIADEAIAAEIKTPLETIREESIDGGSFRVKTPETNKVESDDAKPNLKASIDLIETLEEISEEQEKVNLQEIQENLTEEMGDMSLEEDDAKASFDLDVELDMDLNDEESDMDREMMEKHVNDVMKARLMNNDLGEDDPTTSVSQSGGTTDVKGASLEIHESEIETMILLESEKARENSNCEDLEKAEELANLKDIPSTKESMEDEMMEESKVETQTRETKSDDESPATPEDIENEEKVNLELKSIIDGSGDSLDEIEEPISDKNDSEKKPNISNINNLSNDLIEINSPNVQPNTVDVDMPSLSKCEEPSFANTDSASSSTVTVRPVDVQKQEDSSQDISSLSEPPVPKPKPRKPISASLDESELKENSSDDKENVSQQPVLRRQKSSPKHRGKAMSSKYRSGMVMDDEVSMEEMEAQIEKEMLSQAATKIQAGFRGYKTRKNMQQSGVSGKKKAKLMSTDDEEATADIIAQLHQSDPTAGSVLSGIATAFASADQISSKKEREKPTLGYIRSRSYPGSRDHDEGAVGSDDACSTSESVPNVELDYTYVNKAAVTIQANVRGFLIRRRMRKPKRLGSRKASETVHFDVGDVDFQESYDELQVEVESENDYVSPIGELIINPAERGNIRDSVSPFSDAGSDMAATKIQAAFRGFKSRQKARQTKKAAVTIQATVRGFLTRRRLMKLRRRSFQRRRSSAKSFATDVVRIQKVNDAATKIQAVYRGYQVRSRIRKDCRDE